MLSDIHEDRAKAIVKATELAASSSGSDDSRVDLIEVGENLAMIAVPYSRYLEQSTEISLVQVVPSRFLIVVTAGTPLSNIEIFVEDQLEVVPEAEERDRQILAHLLERLRAARRANRASLAAVVLVNTR
jgi:flagellar biogenesis protein FliO